MCIKVDGLRHRREVKKIYHMPMKTQSAKSFAKPHQTVFMARRMGPRAFCVGADLLACDSSLASLYTGPGKDNNGCKIRCLRGLRLSAWIALVCVDCACLPGTRQRLCVTTAPHRSVVSQH